MYWIAEEIGNFPAEREGEGQIFSKKKEKDLSGLREQKGKIQQARARMNIDIFSRRDEVLVQEEGSASATYEIKKARFHTPNAGRRVGGPSRERWESAGKNSAYRR